MANESKPQLSRKLPTALRVGYVLGMGEADLVRWLNEQADARMVGDVGYAIHAHGRGFAYELHEGGHFTSVLSGVLAKVESEPDAYTPAAPFIAFARTAHGLLAIEAHPLGAGSMSLPDLGQPEGDIPVESVEAQSHAPLKRILWSRWRKYKISAFAGFVAGCVLTVVVHLFI